MDSDRWRRIGTLFDQAVALPPDARRAFLDDACADDPALRDEVLALLEADADPHPALNDPPDDALPTVANGQRIGPYRILRPLGEGGMGTVYLAEREDVGAPVAIKLVRTAARTPRLVERFRHERRILARLHHPNIARFLDAGVTDDDTPYVVLEYVDGQPIDAYCDDRRLSVSERLRLFAEAGRAVQYAHQNFVVHRDLKPSNILVTEDDSGCPQVKLLDFGIAKLTGDDALDAPGLTRTGMRVLTPEYAAPEQVRGEPISAATDVYALGVLLYELLTGQRPYDVAGRSAFEAEQAILTTEPERPSTAVTRTTTAATDDADAETIAPDQARSTTLEQLRRTLRGDLDTIAMKALRKEPERRYPSAEAFVDDIKRHLEGLPVTARPDTLRYRASKFVRRHRGSVIATVAAVLLLVGYAVTATVQAQRIEAQAAEIARERDKAEAVSSFLIDLFRASAPEQALGDTLTAFDLLERGAAQANELADQPETQATMLSVIGEINFTLARYQKADSLLKASLALSASLPTVPPDDIITRLTYLALARERLHQPEAADSLFRQALDRARSAYGPQHEYVARCANNLANFLTRQGRLDEAEQYMITSLDIRRATLDDDDPGIATALQNLGNLYNAQGKYAEAEPLLREALQRRRDHYGDVHPRIAPPLNNLTIALRRLGRFEEAVALSNESLELRRQLYGPEHPRTVTALLNLGSLYKDMGKLDEARKTLLDALATASQWDSPHGIIEGSALNTLGLIATDRKQFDAADKHFEQALGFYRDALGERHYRVSTVLVNWGKAMKARSRPVEAERLFREALSIDESRYGVHRYTARDLRCLSDLLHDDGRMTEAIPVLSRLITVQRQLQSPKDPDVLTLQGHLGAWLQKVERYAEADSVLTTAHKTAQEALGKDHDITRAFVEERQKLYKAWGRPERAERLASTTSL
ncbi:MAG: tetratricopeptide repeat protein [Bacteroidetes bacterium]|jgi:serine/threonine-protein kinase|nr:tetratricopeptide repeat protein [Bacteroidota bacterium]